MLLFIVTLLLLSIVQSEFLMVEQFEGVQERRVLIQRHYSIIRRVSLRKEVMMSITVKYIDFK